MINPFENGFHMQQDHGQYYTKNNGTGQNSGPNQFSGIGSQQCRHSSVNTGSAWNENQNLSERCRTQSPAVHQFLEAWAGNMQKEIERQVKEMQIFLRG